MKPEESQDIKPVINSPDRRKIDNHSPEIQERCPDLNLEPRISPPHHPNYQNDAVSPSYMQQHQPAALVTGGRNSGGAFICFACSLNDEECSCTCTLSLNGTSGNSSDYDFLGLKNVALDYRSLEMK
ncbi:hypothetical protein SSX86_028348 [Deinandra increscens subsp. villosa]|uniref:Uncharacterized protein n=1 Tax=Deinandra increscens subsp. villosa TaxID=3103831 RepID=A0AAP0GLA7_9ASTR